jgi:hypothetical protein
MALLAQTKKGIQDKPPIIIIYGDGGLGKTTFQAEAPKPLIGNIEGGADRLPVDKSPLIQSYDEFVQLVEELTNDKHDYKTFCPDTLDSLEGLLFQKIVKASGKKSMVQAEGGYGNAFKVANEIWIELQEKLRALRDKREMQIIISCHQIVSTYNDPTTSNGYDRYSLKLHESGKISAARLWFDFADCVLFAKRKVAQVGDTRRAVDMGGNVIYTQARAAWDAKNRFGLPFELPLRYADFEAAMKSGPKTAKEILENIGKLVKEVTDQELLSKINENVAEVGNDVISLKNIEERIIEILESQRGK